MRVPIPSGMPTIASTRQASGKAKRRCSSIPISTRSGPRYRSSSRVFIEYDVNDSRLGGFASSTCWLALLSLSLDTASFPISCVATPLRVSWMRLAFGSETAMASFATVIMGPSALAFIPLDRCSGGVTSARNTGDQRACPASPAFTSPTYRMWFGKFSSNTRGSMSADILVASIARVMAVVSRIASGASRSDENPARPRPSPANSSTGRITLRLETPAARMAMISPSLASRPSPIRIPTSTPKGMVSGSTGGSAHRNNASTVRGSALLPTRILKICSSLCRNTTNVASIVPRTALDTTSRNM